MNCYEVARWMGAKGVTNGSEGKWSTVTKGTEWHGRVSMKGTEVSTWRVLNVMGGSTWSVNMKGPYEGSIWRVTWRVTWRVDMKGRHEGCYEWWHEGSKVKYDKVLHLFPSPKIHTNTSERLFNISLHTTLHTTLHFPSLPFTTLQVTLQTGWRVDFWPTEA